MSQTGPSNVSAQQHNPSHDWRWWKELDVFLILCCFCFLHYLSCVFFFSFFLLCRNKANTVKLIQECSNYTKRPFVSLSLRNKVHMETVIWAVCFQRLLSYTLLAPWGKFIFCISPIQKSCGHLLYSKWQFYTLLCVRLIWCCLNKTERATQMLLE